MEPDEMKEWGVARVDRNVVYAMYSGLALLLDVYVPEQPNGYGAIHISGSGWSAPLGPDARPLKESGHVRIEAWPLAKAGYTMFTINHRAAPRFRYPDQVLDCRRAVRWIRANAAGYGIDPGRIGAIGGSSAAQLVTMLAYQDGDGDPHAPGKIDRVSAKVQCVIARAGGYSYIGSGRPGIHPLLGHPVPTEDDGSEEARRAREASPVTYVSAGAPPTLLTHGTEDGIERSEQLRDALAAVGVPVKLVPVEGAGHGPGFPGLKIDIAEIQAEYVAWFDTHLCA